jgi:hypothetical protein
MTKIKPITFSDIKEVYERSSVEIKDILNQNRDFKKLRNEFSGKFNCNYIVNNWLVQVSNHTDSWISTYLYPANPNADMNMFYIASAFAKRVETILNNEIFNR